MIVMCVCTIKNTRAAHIITQAVLPASIVYSVSMCCVAGSRDKMNQCGVVWGRRWLFVKRYMTRRREKEDKKNDIEWRYKR